MPSLLRKLKSFARFRERARAAKAANGNPAPQPSDADDAADDAGEADDAASPAPVTAPAVIPDQRLRPQPPGVAVTSAADNTYSASADKIIVVDVDDVTADNAVVGTAKRPQRGSSHAIPPSPPAPPSSMLEALPAELRLQVLSYISDLCDLKALVFASPVFSQQYRLDRQHFLGRVLLRSLGSLTAEAYAVQGSSTIYSRSPRPLPAETVEQFIHSYVSRRFAPPELILQDCTLTDLAEMAAFYLSVAQPLLPQCAALFLQQLNPSLEVGSLSATEKTRLLRALYRFQLYCNIFGQGPEPALRFRAMEWLADPYILDLFFGSFHPWEVEEIDCIYVLIRNKYDAVFKAVERDLVMKPKITKYDRPTTPPGFWDSNEEATDRESLREGTTLRGLPLFFDILEILAHDEYDELVKTMEFYYTGAGRYESVLDCESQSMRRNAHPSEGDLAEDREEKLPFSSDTEDGPPLAWVIGWRGRYVNRYGTAIPASLKAWGHVVWDRRRLIQSKGTDAVLRARDEYRWDG